MRRFSSIIFLGFIIGIFYTNCTPNQFGLKEQALLTEQQQQNQTQELTTTTQVPLIPNEQSSWKNIYAIAWNGTTSKHLKYAKQMGYDYIALRSYGTPSDYRNNPEFAGFKFYDIGPHLRSMRALSGLNTYNITTTQTYTQDQMNFYNQNMAWKSTDTFPNNLATSCWAGSTKFAPVWDFQQQAVIDKVVEKNIALFKTFESTSLPFTFAGYMMDESRLMGSLYTWDSVQNKEVAAKFSQWTGSDSSLLHGTITHEYATFAEGQVAYYKKLNSRMKQEFPNAKWILEPYRLYNPAGVYSEEWINSIRDRTDKDELTPDMLLQEASGTEFVDDVRIFDSGVNITKDRVGITQPNKVDEYENRLYAAKAGINGAWYNWFGRFGGTGNMPAFVEITEVYPRLKLIRCIPNWDNLNDVSLRDRSWDGSVYKSTKSYISNDLMYSRHWKTGKLFVVFNTTNGVIKIDDGEAITSIQGTDEYFIESGDASADFNISGNEIRLKNSVTIDLDSSNNQTKGRGYIFTLKTSGP